MHPQYTNSVYFPRSSYFDCKALPIEWLELFESKAVLSEIMDDFDCDGMVKIDVKGDGFGFDYDHSEKMMKSGSFL